MYTLLLTRTLTCATLSGWVIYKVYFGAVLTIPFLLWVMMSATETPFGPCGGVALTCKDVAVVRVDKMGGPRPATKEKIRGKITG